MLCLSKQLIKASNINQNNNLILIMIKDYSLTGSLEQEENKDDKLDDKTNNYILQSFSLDQYNKNNSKFNRNLLSLVTKYFYSDKPYIKIDLDLDFHSEIMLLNRAIINATDELLNMCDKMIEKTTSVLPMSYSYKFATDYDIYSQPYSDNTNAKRYSLFDFFSSSTKEDEELDQKMNKDKTQVSVLNDVGLKQQIMSDMVAYQKYRDAINQRNLFLNSLCSHTFGSPYTLYYNSANNTLSYAADVAAIDYYILILQNIIDNSHIRGLNYAFKLQKSFKERNKEGNKERNKEQKREKKGQQYFGLNYDIDLDIDEKKTESLVEKANYILPILQKFRQHLHTYLYDISKRSLTFDEYFVNLKMFWKNIGQEAHIGAQVSPFKYKAELLQAKLKIENERLEKEKEQLENERILELKIKTEMEIDKKAEMEAIRIVKEFKNKQLINDAENYVREQEIIQKDRKTNYSIMEWDHFNRRIKHHMTGITGVLVSGINGLVKAPKDFIINFATETILDLGKVAVLLLVLIYSVLYSFKKIKFFIFGNNVKDNNEGKEDK